MENQTNPKIGQQELQSTNFDSLPKAVEIMKILEGLSYIEAQLVLRRVSNGIIVNSVISPLSDQF